MPLQLRSPDRAELLPQVGELLRQRIDAVERGPLERREALRDVGADGDVDRCPNALLPPFCEDVRHERHEVVEVGVNDAYLAHLLAVKSEDVAASHPGFAPPAPFDLVEMEANEVLPRTYTRDELLGYLAYCRRRCDETLESLTIEQANRICRFAWGELTYAELQLYTMRHLQEHGAQLHMFLGQHSGKPSRWVSQAS